MHTLEFASEEMPNISKISEFQEKRMIKKKRKVTNKPVGNHINILLIAVQNNRQQGHTVGEEDTQFGSFTKSE